MKRKLFVAVLLVLLQVMCAVTVQAELIPAVQEIRVGLTSLYSGKKTLTIHNTELGYGYCVGNTYLQETVLESAEGFTFTPVNGYFVAETASYASYQAAALAAEAYRELGIEAYPGSVYQCSWRVYFGSSGKYAEAEQKVQALENLMGTTVFEILPGSNYRIQMTGGFGTLLIDVDGHLAYPQLRPVTSYEKNVRCVDMGNRVYRGRIEIGRYNKSTLTAVNIVSLEEYLYGVVPSEMPSTWHTEALKAQAVCARSYALMKAGFGGASNAEKGYKIVDTVSSQVYKGYLAESVAANQAVDATKGEMVYYNNKAVSTYFFSTSGGSTEDSGAVWSVELPYLKRVPDLQEQDASREVWQETRTLDEIKKALENQGISFGTIQNLKISGYSPSGRVLAVNIFGGDHSLTLQGTTVRTLLNLYSTKFKMIKQGDTPDEVSVLSAEGMTTGRISEMHLISAEGVETASEELSQYVVQSVDNRSSYPRTAPAAPDEILFAGMGYGHGVGMSQYGAKGMAEAGYTYKEIIEYYFTGAYVK